MSAIACYRQLTSADGTNVTIPSLREAPKMICTRFVIASSGGTGMRIHNRVFFPILLVGCLGQASFAQCHQMPQESTLLTTLTDSTAPTADQRELEDHIVLLTLKLSERGAVRDVEVLKGPERLRAVAIKAARARKYKHRITWPDPSWMMVEVKFPPHGNGAPEIRQALPGGVSSCVYAGQPIRFTPIPWSGVLPPSLDLLLRAQPITPVLAPQSDK
jgi:hypothetical protein